MQESRNLLQLKNRGVILFVYSDKRNLYVIYHDLEGDGVYKFVLDKLLTIESVHELEVPERFKEFKDLHWHKPVLQHNGCFIFSGAGTLEDGTYPFKITDMDVLEIGESLCSPNVFTLLPMASLEDIEVDVHIQKSNKLYVIGYHKETHDQVFVLIDLVQDKILRRYTLCSEVGEIVATTINIDCTDNRLYVGGFIRDPKTCDVLQPYFDSFLMPID